MPRVRWTLLARCSLRVLTAFLESQPFGNAHARRLEIDRAIESLRTSPLRCPVYAVKYGLAFRRLIVSGRFFVFYVYKAPRRVGSGGTLWIRSIKHAATQNPFLGVREALVTDQPLGALPTRENPAPATA